MSLISKASREELEVLALHREAALTGVRRRGEEDNVAVGEIAASGERLDDAALAGKRRVRGRVRYLESYITYIVCRYFIGKFYLLLC